MHLRTFVFVSALAATSGTSLFARQSWQVPSDRPGVETLRDEHGQAARAQRAHGPEAQALPPSSLVANWTALGPFGGDIEDVQVSPIDPNLVLAGLAPSSGGGGAMYRSTDGGATWSTVPTLDGKAVYDIAFAPDGTAYAGTIDGVWKSVNNGVSFTATNLGIGLND